MKEIKHIFLTGEKKVGKSTIIRKALEKEKMKPAGFWTSPYFEGGRFAGYALGKNKNGIEEIKECDKISYLLEDGTGRPIVKTFETKGVTLIEEAMNVSDLIIMDELGRFESKAFQFQDKVKECLDSKKHVVGVLQDTKTDFLDSIRNREDVKIIRVTKQNRDALVKQMKNEIHSFLLEK